MLRKLFLFCLPFLVTKAFAGLADIEFIKSKSIKTVKLFPLGNQLGYPIVKLGAVEQLELHFDDVADYTKSYYYTYQLCDVNWVPVDLSQFDYLKGFSQARITQYRASSIALTRYVHYTINLPEKNTMPTRSGNYIIKVFENGDTSNLLFTKKMLVLDSKAGIAAQMIAPFNNLSFRTKQRLVVNLNTTALDVYNTNQQIKVVVMQNNRWDNAQIATAPTFIRDKILEYNSEGVFEFEGGREWLWLDLRSFRLQSDRVKKGNYGDNSTSLTVHPDTAREGFRYQYYKDYNGAYFIEMLEDYNYWWQSDYANVHFTYYPPAHEPYQEKELYLIGELTQFKTDENSRMNFNVEKGIYEKTLFLKNGYYDYSYVTLENTKNASPSFQFTEGNTWETENQYTVLVYYMGFGGRADELVGVATINSLGLLQTK